MHLKYKQKRLSEKVVFFFVYKTFKNTTRTKPEQLDNSLTQEL